MRSPTNYDRSVKEHNTTPLRGRDDVELVEADLVDNAIDELLDGCDGVFHLAAQPGFAAVSVRASPGAHAITSSQPSGSSRRRRGWGTGGLGLVVDLREHGALSDARGRAACADLALKVTKLTCEHLAHAYTASGDLDALAMRYFTVYGPRQRPDMAFTRIATALVAGGTFRVFGTGEQSRDVTFVAMPYPPRSRRWNAACPAPPTTSAAGARPRARGDRDLSRCSAAALWTSSSSRWRREMSGAPPRTPPRRTPSLTGRRRCPSRMGFAPNSTGSWRSNEATPSLQRTRTGHLSRSGSTPGCPGAARYRVSGAGRGPPSTAYENTTLTSPVSPSGRRCFASVRAPVRSVRVRRPN